MQCRDVIARAQEYLADELDEGARAAIAGHLQTCRSCRDYLATYRATIGLAREAFDAALDPPEEPPEALISSILAASAPHQRARPLSVVQDGAAGPAVPREAGPEPDGPEAESAEQAALRQSEQLFRGLFEEAPIPYVYEETSSRFVSANRAFMRLLGLSPEDVPGTYGRSLLAPTSETQQLVDEAFADIAQGKERSQLEFELRRKDDGRPVWVQFWSRPEPDGKHTRTMIIDITERVLAERERNRLRVQNTYLRQELDAAHPGFEEIVGRSPALAEVLAKVEQVAPTDATVLVLGETGTGKELIARALHKRSRRSGGPLIKLNCAALPTGLIESELFGHEKGAFTGALERRLGRFALADGGTIFLDEIGDVPPDVQVRLLRVLQEQELELVGSAKTIKIDVRVIAATNRDLQQAVAKGTFRADLYYRLNVFPIEVPPLRERTADIGLLAESFARKHAAKLGKRIEAIDERTLERLAAYHWPGNIRELENVIERAVIVAGGSVLEVPPAVLGIRPGVAEVPVVDERTRIMQALERAQGRIEGDGGAAKALGLHPNTLRSRMKKLGLERSRG